MLLPLLALLSFLALLQGCDARAHSSGEWAPDVPAMLRALPVGEADVRQLYQVMLEQRLRLHLHADGTFAFRCDDPDSFDAALLDVRATGRWSRVDATLELRVRANDSPWDVVVWRGTQQRRALRLGQEHGRVELVLRPPDDLAAR